MVSYSKKYYSYVLLIPAALLYFTFFILPTFTSFYFSLTNWNLFGSQFIGLDNFVQFFKEESLVIGLKNTFIYTGVSLFLKMVLGLFLALALNMKLKTQSYLRVVFFFPYVISTLAIGLIFNAILHPSGVLNKVLEFIGLGFLSQKWLTDPNIVIYTVSFIEVWKFLGVCAVILIAGLKSIPESYYEAARVDGVNRRTSFFHITLPLLRSSLNTVFILSLIGGLRSFEIVYVLTQGGPGHYSELLSTVIYKQFANGYYGLATAGSVIMFVVVSIIVFPVYIYLTKKEIQY